VGLGEIVLILVAGFVIGGLARLAVPGPDPMPIWLTTLLGVVGAIGGGTLAIGLGLGGTGIFIVSVLVSTLLVIAYRRVVQKRGITGPDSKRRPTRGPGVGKDTADPVEELKRLGDLRDRGVLTDDEFERKKAELLARI
jgi:uncharacterized membrane protein YeaQ/YmgE (transglycosylase-associated protein family)